MAGYKKQHTDGPNSEDKALDLFAEMMIEKIESIRKDWRKPWFTEEALQWPCNLSGREYNGMNAIMLLIHCSYGQIGYTVYFPYSDMPEVEYDWEMNKLTIDKENWENYLQN